MLAKEKIGKEVHGKAIPDSHTPSGGKRKKIMNLKACNESVNKEINRILLAVTFLILFLSASLRIHLSL